MKDIHNSQDILTAALQTFGGDAQTWKCVEEMGELLQAIGRVKNSAGITATDGGVQFKIFTEDVRKLYDNLQEEIADCIIMLEQMKILYGAEEVDKWMDYKLNRLEEKLSKEAINRWAEEAQI